MTTASWRPNVQQDMDPHVSKLPAILQLQVNSMDIQDTDREIK